MKKTLLFLLCVTFIFTAFVGCAKSEKNSFASKESFPITEKSTMLSTEQTLEGYTKDEIVNTFIQALKITSFKEMEKYVLKYANEIIEYANTKGEDISALADLEVGLQNKLDEYCAEYQMYPNDDTIIAMTDDFSLSAKAVNDEEMDEIYKSICEDIEEYYSSVNEKIIINDIYHVDFDIRNDTCDASIDIFIVETESGCYFLGID